MDAGCKFAFSLQSTSAASESFFDYRMNVGFRGISECSIGDQVVCMFNCLMESF